MVRLIAIAVHELPLAVLIPLASSVSAMTHRDLSEDISAMMKGAKYFAFSVALALLRASLAALPAQETVERLPLSPPNLTPLALAAARASFVR